jgi:hypothetical protein
VLTKKTMKKFLMTAGIAGMLLSNHPTDALAEINIHLNLGGRGAPIFAIDNRPDFMYLPDLGFYVSVGDTYDMIYFGDLYYLYRDGLWYRSSYYRGPWIIVRDYDLPYRIRRHRWNRIRMYRDVEYRRHDRQYWNNQFDSDRSRFHEPGNNGGPRNDDRRGGPNFGPTDGQRNDGGRGQGSGPTGGSRNDDRRGYGPNLIPIGGGQGSGSTVGQHNGVGPLHGPNLGPVSGQPNGGGQGSGSTGGQHNGVGPLHGPNLSPIGGQPIGGGQGSGPTGGQHNGVGPLHGPNLGPTVGQPIGGGQGSGSTGGQPSGGERRHGSNSGQTGSQQDDDGHGSGPDGTRHNNNGHRHQPN